MATSMVNEQRQIAKKFLLASPPGQFQQTLMDLNAILDNDENYAPTTTTILSRDFINHVQAEYNSNTGREVLLQSKTHGSEEEDDSTTIDEFGKSLKVSFQNYTEKHYRGKDVESNYCVTITNNTEQSKVYEIIVYAERIKLKQFHAGSWFAKYTITANEEKKNSEYTVSGVVLLHGHSFEDGNVHVHTNVTLPSKVIQSLSSTAMAEAIINVIQSWDEEHVLRPLKGLYHDLSSDLLKKVRRVMPVTRTKFDWNLSGHRFIRAMERDVQGNN